jgi:hypothetical protein
MFDEDHGINNQAEEDLTRGFQSLGISQSSNPFRSRTTTQTTGYSLFVSQEDNGQGYAIQPATTSNPFRSPASASAAPYAQRSVRRASGPTVGHAEQSPYANDHQLANRVTAGYLTPTHGRLRSRTPAIGHSQSQQYAATLRRPQSAQDRSSSRSSEHSSASSSGSGSNMRGMKVQKQKDWRGFFKLGRVCVLG